MREYRSADSTRDTASFSGQACTPGSPQKSLSSRSEARDLLQLPCEANCAPAKAHTLHPVSGAVSEWPTLRTLTHEHSPAKAHTQNPHAKPQRSEAPCPHFVRARPSAVPKQCRKSHFRLRALCASLHCTRLRATRPRIPAATSLSSQGSPIVPAEM
jgi:hypothetical protein